MTILFPLLSSSQLVEGTDTASLRPTLHFLPLFYILTCFYSCDITILPFIAPMYVLGHIHCKQWSDFLCK
jgi:hypothetical protein